MQVIDPSPQGPHSHIVMTGGSEGFFGSDILAKRDFLGVYERRRDFFGSQRQHRVFLGYFPEDE